MRNKQPDEIFCTECGGIIKKSARFCSHCGVQREEQPVSTVQKEVTSQESAGSNYWDQQTTCPKCGRVINASSSTCSHCNTPIIKTTGTTDDSKLSSHTCKYCGHLLGAKEKSCPRCGTVSVTQNSSTSERKRIPALLLLLFLGGFGAHRFYVGKIKSAMVILIGHIFFWGFYIKYFFSTMRAFSWDYLFLSLKNFVWLCTNLIKYSHYEEAIFVLLGLGIAVILLVDLVMIITGSFRDSEGKALS